MSTTAPRDVLAVCDGPAPDAAEGVRTVSWSLPAPGSRVESLAAIVDRSFESLSAEYMEWCGSLAAARAGASTVSERLRTDLLDGASFWWTTLVAAHSTIATPQIADVLKLRALERLYGDGDHRGLVYTGANTELAGVLGTWMRALGHSFEWRRRAASNTEAAQPWTRRTPHVVQAIVQLAYFVLRRYRPATRGQGRRAPVLPDASVAILTFVPNVDMARAAEGRFHSNYWGALPDVCADLGLRTNWIWFYHPSRQMTFAETAAFRDRVNSGPDRARGQHALLEQFLTPARLASAVWTFARLAAAGLGLRALPSRFVLRGSRINFFPLMRDQWRSSLRGAEAMSACLYAAAFRGAADHLPAATTHVLFPWENQTWEQAFVPIWRARHARSSIAGVVHTPSVTSPSDLRARYESPARAARPVPDALVAFGAVAANRLRQWGWPAAAIVEAEALRYAPLAGRRGRLARALPASSRRLLVVGGILRSESAFQIALLSAASALGALDGYASVVVKPHPFCPVDDLVSSHAFTVRPSVESRPLDGLLAECDVVFAANSTSASIEAAWLGLPLVITAAADGVNLNPLAGSPGAQFVATPEALRDALLAPARVEIPAATFHLDAAHSRWRALLSGSSAVPQEARAAV